MHQHFTHRSFFVHWQHHEIGLEMQHGDAAIMNQLLFLNIITIIIIIINFSHCDFVLYLVLLTLILDGQYV